MTQDERITALIHQVKALADMVEQLQNNDKAIKRSLEFAVECIEELGKRR